MIWDDVAASVFADEANPNLVVLVCKRCHNAKLASEFVLFPPSQDVRGVLIWHAVVECNSCFAKRESLPPF